MDPITVAIAGALGVGFGKVSETLIEKGIVEPALKPAIARIARRVTKGYQHTEADKALQAAVAHALKAAGAPEQADKLTQYLIHRGFDELQAKDNIRLRQEIAQAALLQTSPDPTLVPERLFASLRMPADSRLLLAQFLYHLRQQLKEDAEWGPLIEESRQEAAHTYLQQMAHNLALTATAAQRAARYQKLLLDYYGLHDTSDEQAQTDYLAHLIREYQHLSFVLTKARRRERLSSEAELENVFVPLQVQDPEAIRHSDTSQAGTEIIDRDKSQALTINEVLAKYPTFLLIGPPGAGKTTLLRHLIISFAQGEAAQKLNWTGDPLFPIIVPLRNFGRFLAAPEASYTNPSGSKALREFIAKYFDDHELKLPPNFFRDRLDKGRCLVLLDGLDEVADQRQRARVAQFVNGFIKHYQEKGNRFGLASRPRGYEQVQQYLTRPMICTVQPLTPDDRDKLVGNLLYELEPNPRLRRQNTRDLIANIRQREKVDQLSRNPLFCTTLVLVFKYQGTLLPERRVDVYQELVNLMLGFWETHKEGVADVHELVLMDGTNRPFMDEREAVEAKERTLIHLAGWMQAEGLTDIPKADAIEQLAGYFEAYEGASAQEKTLWARNFLDVAHQRSGLFVEYDTGAYAFSHKNFLEYLAAVSLVNRLDQEMVDTFINCGDDPSWEEVLRLAFAHERLPHMRYKLLVEGLLQAGYILLAGRCITDAGTRVPAPLRHQVQEVLYKQMTATNLSPQQRFAAGEILDETKWLPPDLNQWIHCPGCADNRQDLWVGKYPVTNTQFSLFMAAGGYENPAYWDGENSLDWQWRLTEHDKEDRGEGPVTEPEYWHDPRFGQNRRGYPVVGVSWYEARAYTRWLTHLLTRQRSGEDLPPPQQALIADLLPTVPTIQLPTEREWARMAGGEGEDRYPWDKPGYPVTTKTEEIVQRANVGESDIDNISPVAMYPQGASVPFGLMDLAGNVWEWTNSWDNERRKSGRVVRGGSWIYDRHYARVSVRDRPHPQSALSYDGFRVVAPSFLAPDF